MAIALTPSPRQQFMDANGDPLAFGKVYTYIAGTTTNLATYTSSTGATQNANPVILDSSGRAPIWLTQGSAYKFVVKTSADVLVYTEDGVSVPNSSAALAASGGAGLIGFLQSGAGAVARTLQDKERDIVSLKDFAPVGDGSTDDSAKWQSALNAAAGKTLIVPPPTTSYKVAAAVTISANTHILFLGGATVKFDFPVGTAEAAGGCFEIGGSGVTIEGGTFTCGVAATNISGHRFAIRQKPSGSTRYTDIKILRCNFTSLSQYSGSIPNTTNAMHGVKLIQCDRAEVWGCKFDTLSGAGVWLLDTTDVKVDGNDFVLFGWSGVWLENTNYDWAITRNKFSGTTSGAPSYWGGAIDVMGQTSDATSPGSPDERGTISGNKFQGGYYRYGQVLRLSSCRSVTVTDNIFDQPDVDQVPTGHQNHITVTVRDVTLNNGPWKNIVIANNIFRAKGTGTQKAVHVITTSGTRTNTTAAEGLTIANNQMVCPDASNYFGADVYVHGFASGITDLLISGNRLQAISDVYATPLIAVGGHVTLLSDAGKTVDDVRVLGNRFERIGAAGTTNNHAGLNIQADITNVQVSGNKFKNMYRGVWVDSANAGNVPIPVHNIYSVAGSTIVYRGNPMAVVGDEIEVTDTYDPASIPDGDAVNRDVTLNGAALGDLVEVSFSLDLQGIILHGSVTSANTLRARFQNETGGAVDLGSGTLRFRVRKTV